MNRLPFAVLTADEAAALIDKRDTIGFGGFTAAVPPRPYPAHLAHEGEFGSALISDGP